MHCAAGTATVNERFYVPFGKNEHSVVSLVLFHYGITNSFSRIACAHRNIMHKCMFCVMGKFKILHKCFCLGAEA